MKPTPSRTPPRRRVSSAGSKGALLLLVALCGLIGYSFFVGVANFDNSNLSPAPLGVDPTLQNDGNPPKMDCSPIYPKVIVYNRIPKAGSSTIITLLKKMSRDNDFKLLVPRPKHDPVVARAAIVHAMKQEGRTVVVEHFGYPDYLSPDLAYINVMRNPVERCISAFNYARWGPRAKEARAKSLRRYGNITLEECMDKPWDELIDCFNCNSQGQARFLCGPEYSSCDRPHAEEMLRRAWYNVESQYFVGITEDLQTTVDVLEGLYPTFFKNMGAALAETPPQRVNADSSKKIPERTWKRIEEWTTVDRILYTRVQDKLQKLHTACMARRKNQPDIVQ